MKITYTPMTTTLNPILPDINVPLSAQTVMELLLLSALWGGSFLFMRAAAPEFGPVALIAVRVALAALLMLPLLLRRPERTALRKHWRAIAVVGVFNSALPFCLFALAAVSLSAGFTAMLNATAALWSAALGWCFFGQRVQPRAALGLALALCGVVALVWSRLAWPDVAVSRTAVAWAIVAAVAATACYGACAHYARLRLGNVSPMVVAAGSQVAAALLLALPGWWLWPIAPPTTAAWLAVVGLGLLSTALAYVLYFRLIANIGAARAMTVTLLVPVIGVILGVLVLGESIDMTSGLGALLVLLGTGLALNPQRSAPRDTFVEPSSDKTLERTT